MRYNGMNELQMKVLVSHREQQRHRFAFKSLEPIASAEQICSSRQTISQGNICK